MYVINVHLNSIGKNSPPIFTFPSITYHFVLLYIVCDPIPRFPLFVGVIRLIPPILWVVSAQLIVTHFTCRWLALCIIIIRLVMHVSDHYPLLFVLYPMNISSWLYFFLIIGQYYAFPSESSVPSYWNIYLQFYIPYKS